MILDEQTTEFGTFENLRFTSSQHGFSTTWKRVDKFTTIDGQSVIETHFCAGPQDATRLHRHYRGPDKYDSECSCCYLGFSHTVALHNQKTNKENAS